MVNRLKMNSLLAVGSILLLLTVAVSAQTPAAVTVTLSPASQKIALAQAAIRKNPEYVEYHNDLASAFTRRALETADALYYTEAEDALRNSFRLAPDNYNGQKIRVQILLGKHEYAEALKSAKNLNARVADDIPVYGLIADAAIELGNYKEAEQAVEWMLNLRHAGAGGHLRVAYLRELYGDVGGALEAMDSAYEMTSDGEVEERARILTQSARLALRHGNIDLAGRRLRHALKIFPEYHLALFHLASVRTAQQKHAEAIELLQRANQSPQNLYALAKALGEAQRSPESKRAFAQFEEKARTAIGNADNANRELIFFYTDYAPQPAEALRIARLEIARRQDVHTLDAFAWSLQANGKYREAREQIEKALAVGIRNADFFYHYAVILSKLNDTAAAARYFQQSLDLNPLSPSATVSRKALKQLAPPNKPQ